MPNKDSVIKDLTQEQVEQVSGGDGEILARYIKPQTEDTKGGGDQK